MCAGVIESFMEGKSPLERTSTVATLIQGTRVHETGTWCEAILGAWDKVGFDYHSLTP